MNRLIKMVEYTKKHVKSHAFLYGSKRPQDTKLLHNSIKRHSKRKTKFVLNPIGQCVIIEICFHIKKYACGILLLCEWDINNR